MVTVDGFTVSSCGCCSAQQAIFSAPAHPVLLCFHQRALSRSSAVSSFSFSKTHNLFWRQPSSHHRYLAEPYLTAKSESAERSYGELLAKENDHVWEQLRQEALEQSEEEPHLASYFYATVLVHSSLERSLAFHLANKLASPTLLSTQLFTLFWETFAEDSDIQEALRSDIRAFKERDPACTSYVHGMLNYKGFLACEAHRIAHRLWGQGRFALALALQNRISEVFHVDIHPGAQIGKGVLFDHATGVVIGETAVIGNNVSILHHVTLGGTGNCCGNRHPRIGNGVLIGAGAILLGSISVGDGAKVGACSLVLIDVPPHTTAVGVPAQILGREGKADATPVKEELPALSMDHTSLILDYII